MLRLFSGLLFVLVVQRTQAQDEGLFCETPDQISGICTAIKECPVLLNMVTMLSRGDANVINYLRKATCAVRNGVPIVCCPNSTPRNQPIDDNPVISPKIGNLLKAPNCGYNNLSLSRVVGGQPAKLGEFPWMVALGYRNSQNPDMPKYLCGGTLITNRHILTAGHCVYQRQDLYMARVGDLDLYDDNDGAFPENIPLINAKIHEDYNPTAFTNDIAILTMQRAPTGSQIKPICLPFEEPLRSANLVKRSPYVAGWGTIYFRGPSSSILQLASIPVVPNENCEKAFGDRTTIDNRILCAGYKNGEKDACKGDSGGPLMDGRIVNSKPIFYQIGVVSYGFKCAEPGWPGVYTRVTEFIDWISKNVM